MSGWYRAAWPLLRRLPPETAHRLALRALRLGLAPRAPSPDPAPLAARVFGVDFANPIGLAAGFDKDGEAVDAALALGFGFVEAGTVTPRPQPGNPRPRLFRLMEDEALINRMGFNNRGLAALASRLAARPRLGVVGANIGRNKDTGDVTADYLAGLEALHDHAGYLVVNVSSPNTPGLRELQGRDALEALLGALVARRAEITPPGRAPTPLLVKIAPDLAEGDREDVAGVALAAGIDGLIVANTTTAREGLRGSHAGEAGGLSGRPLFAPSTALLADLFRLTRGRLPLIGVGGVFGADDAYAKIRNGASLVQLYTGLVYRGPGLVTEIKRGLAARLAADGFTHIADAVGMDVT
jgi:dihydroorotate dehydrogenase